MRCRGYRQSVTLQELQGSTVGGTRGETQQTWKDFRTVRASVRELSARERELGRQIDVVATHEVRMHYQGFRLQLRRAVKTRAAGRSRKYTGTVTRLGEGFFKGKTFYGGFLEFGTEHIQPRHFMKGAADQNKHRAGRKAVVIIRREIEQASKM